METMLQSPATRAAPGVGLVNAAHMLPPARTGS
jgi:hypothetical protein